MHHGEGDVDVLIEGNVDRLYLVALEHPPKKSLKSPDVPAPPAPPWIAEFVLTLLANTAQREGALGDLSERFQSDCEVLGTSRAARLYWARCARSVWPLLRSAIGRGLKWTAILAFLKRIV
jgi:hypothetical protein